MGRKFETVGIDLGTTYSSIAYVDELGNAQVVVNPDDQRPIIPSAVFFDDGDAIVGETALENARAYPKQVAQFAKRSLGEQKPFQIGNQSYSPEAISAMVLKKLIQCAEKQIGETKRAVITVPAFFNESRRAATQSCGELAGLTVEATLNEPSAALIAYGLHKSDEERTCVVYDLGGGTFDVTVMKVGKNSIRELATGGNRELGGIDWDEKLVEFVADDFLKSQGVDPRDDAISFQSLWTACRLAKIQLGKLRKTIVQCAHAGKHHRVEVTREKFEKLTRQLLTRTEMTVEACIREAGLSWADIDDVMLVGGSTNMPMVQNMLRTISGKEPRCDVDPATAVARGAAIYAGVLETHGRIAGAETALGQEVDTTTTSDDGTTGSDPETIPIADGLDDDIEVIDLRLVNSHGIGVFANKGEQKINVVMIPRNTELPAKQEQQFRLRNDGGRELKVRVSEGDNEDRDGCELLGVCKLSPLPPGLKKGTPVTLSLGFDRSGRVSVSAVCNGSTVHAEIVKPGAFTEKEFEAAKDQIDSHNYA